MAVAAALVATMQQVGSSPWLMGFPTLLSAPRPTPDRVLPAVVQQQAPVSPGACRVEGDAGGPHPEDGPHPTAVPYHGYPDDRESMPEVLTTQRGDTMGVREAVAIAVAAEEISPSPGRSPTPCTNSLGHFWATSIDHCGS